MINPKLKDFCKKMMKMKRRSLKMKDLYCKIPEKTVFN